MARETKSTSDFEDAIKNFSKLSLEVDSLINAGNVDAHRLMNRSIEHRNEAIANEATKRLKSFEVEQKGTKSKESFNTHDTMKQLFFEEAKMEFDKGVAEEKIRLRSDSAIDVNEAVANKKSENSEDNNSKDGSDEESESESEEDTDDTDTTEKDSSGDDEDSSSSDSDADESTEDEAKVDEAKTESVDSIKK